jgi:GTPase
MPPFETAVSERAILVGVVVESSFSSNGRSPRERAAGYLEELSLLAESAGAVVVHRITQERRSIDAAFFIGKGKAQEVEELVEKDRIDLVIFDDDLSSVQVRNLERLIKCKILDRSGLILSIFASRARTSEAKTQVELAQLQYLLPRLTRQWTHLSKQFGGIGTKGPGETQIETDRRAIRTKISHLNGKLNQIARERAVQRKGREKFPRVALVGYTNAGKSTILNWFTQADVLVEDRLFATLDSTVRMLALSPAHKILLSDTVGFIRKLPHHLVASFKSTLEEVTEANIILHVVDVSHPSFEEQIEVVQQTLEDLGAHGKPTVVVFNKIDKLTDRSILGRLAATYKDSVCVSAARGINMASLEKHIITILNEDITELSMTFGQQDYDIISQLHDIAEILDTSYDGEEITIRFRVKSIHGDQLLKSLARKAAR